MKKFNTTGVCLPEKHYMVNIQDRILQIKKMVEEGKYFSINRSRQYGKTTVLTALKREIKKEFLVLSLDFQSLSYDAFKSEGAFSQAFAGLIKDLHDFADLLIPTDILDDLGEIMASEQSNVILGDLFRVLRNWMKKSILPIVLMVDEVDSASNNQVFLDFLAQLRDGFLKRDTDGMPAFHSVILAGVTDIRHLKNMIRNEEQRRVNSPWNIASDFSIDLSFYLQDIIGMLEEYEEDFQTGMDIPVIAGLIRDYTGGYPFLVSRICQIIEERLVPTVFKTRGDAWTRNGIDEAVKLLLTEKNTLFESLMGKLANYPDLKQRIRRILMQGETAEYLPYDDAQQQLFMFGFLKREGNNAVLANRLFETVLYNHFLGENGQGAELRRAGDYDKNIFVENGNLNLPLILERFVDTFHKIYGEPKESFLEKEGRELFLLYLKPIINGTGNYYIEAQTRTQARTDIVVDYLGKQYVIEMKIWRGAKYHEHGERQIKEYLDYFGLQTGYLLSFDFRKKKQPGMKRVRIGDKVLFEATV